MAEKVPLAKNPVKGIIRPNTIIDKAEINREAVGRNLIWVVELIPPHVFLRGLI